MVRNSTESLVVQLDHVWSLKRFLGEWQVGGGIDAIDRLTLHLDAIRGATADHEEIAASVAETHDECLQYVFARQRGDHSATRRAEMLGAMDRLQDRILSYPAVEFGRRQ